MPQLGIQFDASKIQPAEPGGNVWEGVVPMRIVRSEIADTSAKDGSKMLVVHVVALAGEYTSQENVIRLNLWNRNPQASEIAQRQLSSICHVTGKMQLTDSDALNGATLIGVWAKETRKVTDQATGRERELESCQCKDFRLIDGRTIKEMVGGQPASNPYQPGAPANMSNPQGAAVQPGMQPQPAPQPAQPQNFGAPQGGPQPGFPQGGAAPQGFTPPGAGGQPNPQHAPQMGGPAPAGGFVPPGQGGAMPGTAPGFSTAGSPSNGAPPQGFGQAPQGGFGAPGGAPGGFGAPQAPQGQPQGGFQPGGQPGGFGAPGDQPGPWGRQ